MSVEWAVATPVDEIAELNQWRQMSARALSSTNYWRNRVTAMHALRFWEMLGYIGALADAAASIRFYQEQADIAVASSP